MTKTRSVTYAQAATPNASYVLLGASAVALADAISTSQAASSSLPAPVAYPGTVFLTTTVSNPETTLAQNEFDALQRLWHGDRKAHPQTGQSATENDLELLIVEPEDLGHFTPTYGAPVQMTFLPPQEGRFKPIELDEIDLEIFDV